MKKPELEFVCAIKVNVGKPYDIGNTGNGTRKIIPLLGGIFEGPNMRGTILEGGADWQMIKKNDVADISARYILKTDDDALIYLSNSGIRVASNDVLKQLAAGEFVNEDAYYFRTVPVFETSSERYTWLMTSIFIAKGIRNPDNVEIQVWRVL